MNPNLINEFLYSDQMEPFAVALVLGAAFVLGAIHALGPGHGKSLMAAYLVGTRGRLKDVFLLAASFTIAHVFSVFVIGVITLVLTDFFWSETLNKWISLASGFMIIGIGLWLLISRIGSMKHHDHPHDHAHQHPHNHGHDPHFPAANISDLDLKKSILLGISGGIVPCPKALVILFLAISLHKIVLGLVLIIVFSLGLASVLATIGIILVKASHVLNTKLFENQIRIVPVAGSIIVLILGVLMTLAAWKNI